MKKIAVAALAALALWPARAAAEPENTDPMWGVRVGVDLMLPGNWHANDRSFKMYSAGKGVTAGAVCNLYLGRGFYFEPGVSLFYDTYAYDDFSILADDETATVSPSIYKVGVRVPLNVGYEFNIAGRLPMTVYTGPELSYAFAGGIRLKPGLEEEAFEGMELFGPSGEQRRFDLAWKIGIGFPVGSFVIGLDGAIGVTDLLKGGVSFRENKLTLGATYFF